MTVSPQEAIDKVDLLLKESKAQSTGSARWSAGSAVSNIVSFGYTVVSNGVKSCMAMPKEDR